MAIQDSEFKAKQDITLHYKDGKPCGSVIEGSIEIKIKKGQFIPEMFVKTLILYNPEYIDFESKDSVPQLTIEQKEKYGFVGNLPTVQKKETPSETLVKDIAKFTKEELLDILSQKKSKKFKDWAEEIFGKDAIDKRKSAETLIEVILKLQK